MRFAIFTDSHLMGEEPAPDCEMEDAVPHLTCAKRLECWSTRWGKLGCHSRPPLADAIVAAAADELSDDPPQFVLLLGDIAKGSTFLPQSAAAQATSKAATASQYSTFVELVRHKFPAALILPTVGNADTTPQYYVNASDPAPYSHLAPAVAPSLGSADAARSFETRGYYVATISPSLVVLSLNTILFVPKSVARLRATSASAVPTRQLAWLRSQLEAISARGAKAVIIGHVPPVRMPDPPHASLWDPQMASSYWQVVRQYSESIVSQHFGHMHIDAMYAWHLPSVSDALASDPDAASRAAAARAASPPLSVMSSISMWPYNRPAFYALRTDEQTRLASSMGFFADLSAAAPPPLAGSVVASPAAGSVVASPAAGSVVANPAGGLTRRVSPSGLVFTVDDAGLSRTRNDEYERELLAALPPTDEGHRQRLTRAHASAQSNAFDALIEWRVSCLVPWYRSARVDEAAQQAGGVDPALEHDGCH